MRPRKPLLIIKEYLEPNEPPQVRKNALSALAALGDAESLTMLAQIALNEPEPQLRDRAEAEISSLAPSTGLQAIQPLLHELKGPETYALLGRLRNRGMTVRLPRMGIVKRLRLAKSLRNLLYPKRGFLFYFRTMKGMSLGVLVAMIPCVSPFVPAQCRKQLG